MDSKGSEINLNALGKNSRDLPALHESKEQCCGCAACAAVCPVSAIKMLPDEEGFLYPEVDACLCIKCYNCMKVCAFK